MAAKKSHHRGQIHRTKAIPNRVGIRRRMPASAFAVPETHAYPIPDAYHAELALTALLRVVGRHGVSAEGRRTAREVLAAVRHKFPRVYQKEQEIVAEIHDQYGL